jgi:hypothetical protein
MSLPIKAAGTAASFRGVYARARVTFKAARFRARKSSLVQLRAAEAVPARAIFPHEAAMVQLPFQSKGHTMSKTNNLPSHRVYAVTKEGKKSYWRGIGAVWPHGDGEGFNMKLDYLPLNPDAEIVIRKPKAEADEAEAPAGETA